MDYDAYLAYPTDSECVSPSSCPDTCRACREQYCTQPPSGSTIVQKNSPPKYQKKLTDHEARKSLARLTSNINDDLAYLRGFVQTGADIVVTRWMKKTKANRTTLLQSSAHNMNPESFFAKFLEMAGKSTKLVPHTTVENIIRPGHVSRVPKVGTLPEKYRNSDSVLLPWLDMQSILDDPMHFLSLLDNRTKFESSDWMLFDSRQMKTVPFTNVSVEFNAKCVIMHGSQYGQLVEWNEIQAHRWDIVGFPRAQMVLRAQEVLMKFLRRMVESLTAAEGGVLGTVKWDRLRQDGFKGTNEQVGLSTYRNQPFSPPPQFAVSTCLELANSRLAATRDEVWLLQIDPLYTQQTAQDHRLRAKPGEHFWKSLIEQVMLAPICRSHIWHYIVDQLEKLRKSHHYDQKSARAGSPLSLKYDEELSALEFVLCEAYSALQAMLAPMMSSMKGLQGSVLSVASLKDPLLFVIGMLHLPPDQGASFEPSLLFRFLDSYLSKANGKERARLDAVQYVYLSDLAGIHEILTALRSQRPRHSQLFDEKDKVVRHKYRYIDFQIRTKGTLLDDKQWEVVVPLFSDFVDSPWPKKLTAGNALESMTSTRTKLAGFWQAFRRIFAKRLKDSHWPEEWTHKEWSSSR